MIAPRQMLHQPAAAPNRANNAGATRFGRGPTSLSMRQGLHLGVIVVNRPLHVLTPVSVSAPPALRTACPWCSPRRYPDQSTANCPEAPWNALGRAGRAGAGQRLFATSSPRY